MARTVGIGIQNFEKVIKENCFYIDKTEYGTYRALLIDNACLYRGKVYPMLNKQKMT